MKSLFFLLLMLNVFPVKAYQSTCSKSGTVIIYSNGLDATKTQSKMAFEKLVFYTTEYENIIDNGFGGRENHVDYIFVYNSKYQDFDDAELALISICLEQARLAEMHADTMEVL